LESNLPSRRFGARRLSCDGQHSPNWEGLPDTLAQGFSGAGSRFDAATTLSIFLRDEDRSLNTDVA
jgi:hypothetical protein